MKNDVEINKTLEKLSAADLTVEEFFKIAKEHLSKFIELENPEFVNIGEMSNLRAFFKVVVENLPKNLLFSSLSIFKLGKLKTHLIEFYLGKELSDAFIEHERNSLENTQVKQVKELSDVQPASLINQPVIQAVSPASKARSVLQDLTLPAQQSSVVQNQAPSKILTHAYQGASGAVSLPSESAAVPQNPALLRTPSQNSN